MATSAAALMRMLLLVVFLVQMFNFMAMSAKTLKGDPWLKDGIGMVGARRPEIKVRPSHALLLIDQATPCMCGISSLQFFFSLKM